MHPFHWVPAEGLRHASCDQRPKGGYRSGQQVTTLCGRGMPAEAGDIAWLWETCRDCNHQAHRMAAAPLTR